MKKLFLTLFSTFYFVKPLKIVLIFQFINLLNLKLERKVGMQNGFQIRTQRCEISTFDT